MRRPQSYMADIPPHFSPRTTSLDSRYTPPLRRLNGMGAALSIFRGSLTGRPGRPAPPALPILDFERKRPEIISSAHKGGIAGAITSP